MMLQRLLRRSEDALATVLDLRKAPPTAAQTALAARLVTDLTTVAAGEGGASAFWRDICRDLRTLAATTDPRFFMRWPAIGATMVHGAAPVTFKALAMLWRSGDWRTRWAPALRHPQHGHPPPFLPMLSTNAMAIEHAAHLCRFRQHTGRDLFDTDCIIEFGGGFGSMCRLVRALGYRGRYIIFDLPPVLALQRYYLGMHGIEASIEQPGDTWLCPDLDAVRAELERTQPRRVSLVSTWALSEMPLPVRRRIEPFFALTPVALALLAYQPSFEGNDNAAYFGGVTAALGDGWRWDTLPVDPSAQSAGPADSVYLFGVAQPRG